MNTVTGIDTTWQQVSGDMTASEYGATFAQLDTLGDKVYGVRIVEIINMVEACGRDYDVKQADGAYVTEESYVDVDDMNLARMREIMHYSDLARLADGTPEYPDDVSVHVEMLQGMAADMRKLERWQGNLTDAQHKQLDGTVEELDTLSTWYAIPRMQRAEAMHSYGGYTDGQSLTFKTLQDAMDYHSIPASALWRASEYESVPDDCKLDNEIVKLYNVEGISRQSGNDAKDNTGCNWLQQFWSEIEDSAIEAYYNGDDATESAALQGAWRKCVEECCICHTRIDGDAWANLDVNGELACDRHFKIVTYAK